MDQGNFDISYRFRMGQFQFYMYSTSLVAGFIMFMCLLLQRFGSRRKKRLPPGPPGVPFIGHLHLLGQLPHQSLTRLSKKYGPVMSLRLGSLYTVVVSSPDTAKEILKTQDHIFASRPSTITGEVVLQNSDLIWAPLGERWQTLKKTCIMELLNPKIIEAYKQVRRDAVLKMVRGIVHESGGRNVVRLEHRILEQMYSNVTQLLFAKSYHRQNGSGPGFDNEAGQLVHLIDEVMAIGPLAMGDFLPVIRKLDLDGKEAKLRVVGAKFNEFFQGMIEERRRRRLNDKGMKNQDFLDVLLSIQNDSDGNGKGLSDDRIRAVLIDLITAGSETSANTVAWVVSELMRHPDVLQKVQSELDLVVGRERLVEESDIPQLTYLRAVVKETFRLHPVAPLLMPHYSLSAAQVGGYDIPSKTQVFINAYAIARDPTLWEKALEFLPDRFLTSSADIDTNGQNFQFLPFGSGRRKCVGANLGLLFVESTLATLLHTCELSLPEGMNPDDLNMEEAYGFTVPRAKPLEVLISARIPCLISSNDRLG